MEESKVKNRHLLKVLRAAAFPVVIALLLLSGTIASASGRTVRVGFPPIPGISFYDKNGRRTGYYYELLERIAKTRDWDLEYRDAPWHQCLSLLSTGEIDILVFTGKSPGQEQLFNSSRETVTTTWITVLLQKDLAYKEINDLQRMTIALVKGLDETSEFIQWMQSADIIMVPLYSNDSEQQIRLFESGKAKAILVPSNLAAILLKTGKYLDSRIIFDAESRGFSVRKGTNQDLLDAIDETLRDIKAYDSAYLEGLEAKYLSLPDAEYIMPIWLKILIVSLLAAGFIAVLFIVTLQHQVNKHTKEIRSQRDKLQEKTIEVEKANKELESFSYSVSHDLRAPLRALAGFSSLLMTESKGKMNAQCDHYLLRIQDSTIKMQKLIDDILHLSRMTRKELQRSVVDLSAIANAIAAELREREGSTRSVSFVIAERLTAMGDGELLGIAIENLLNNAWKFSKPRQEAVIEFGASEESGTTVYFIRDNGVGFDMAYADKLFTPFQRLHSEQEFPGTGIGLATIKRVIERHGGKVWIESELGKGTTVRFTLES